MKAKYDPETRTLTILIRPNLKEHSCIDFSEGTLHPIPLRIGVGDYDEKDKGYAVFHKWSDVDLWTEGDY